MEALTAARLCHSLYTLPKGSNGPFSVVLHEKEDYGVNCGIVIGGSDVTFVFRGSVTPEDWMRDAVSELPCENGLWPEGFYMGLTEAFPNLSHFVDPGKKIVSIGHSLGAPHALIFLNQLGLSLDRQLFLFESPRCVPEEIERPGNFPVNAESFQNGDDFVCDVPFGWVQPYPLIKIHGGHDTIPNLFMFHHIDYVIEGLEKRKEALP